MDRKVKILRVSHIFTPAQMGRVMAGIGNFNELPFREQMSRLAELKVDNCESLSRELRALGHQVEDVYSDLEVPQKKWARENDVAWEPQDWENQILLKQIEKIKPEILFIQKTTKLPGKTLNELKKTFAFLRKIVLHTAYLGSLGDVGYADILLVGTPSLVDRFRRQGFNPTLFYHYFDPEILAYLKPIETHDFYPVTFLGSSGFGGGYLHADRFDTLYYLMEKTVMQAWVSEPSFINRQKKIRETVRLIAKKSMDPLPEFILEFISKSQLLPTKCRFIANECLRQKEFHRGGRALPSLPLRSFYHDRCHDAVMGMEYYQIMAGSKISFTKACNNIFDGESCNKGDIGALRLFEATGLGSCLVADTGPNMSDLFKEDKEIITYTSKEEAVEKINYLLAHEKERQSVALAGQARTLRDHTAAVRAIQFDEVIQESI